MEQQQKIPGINSRSGYLCLLYSVLLVVVWIAGVPVALRAQAGNKDRISVAFTNASVVTVLEAIGKQSAIRLSFSREDLAGMTIAVFRVKDVTTKAALDELCKVAPLEYTLLPTVAAIRKKNIPAQGHPAPVNNATGTLRGRIVDFETSQPLPAATVRLEGAAVKAVIGDEKGYYAIGGLGNGNYTLMITYTGYAPFVQSLKVNGDMVFNIKMQAGGTQLSTVVISSGVRKLKTVTHTTDKQMIEEIRTARSVVSGISSEQITKSADRNAAEVVRKIAGVTVRDDKFIVVRGLNERYNLTYLNNNIAPSTELYSRAFALDLIPSRIIDRILVYKSPAPDLLADMTGGAIKIFTKDAKNIRHFDMELQLGGRPGTTFNNNFLTYQGGKFDFLGFDDGIRKLPSSVPGFGDFTKANISQATYAKTFSPILQYGKKTALPTMQVTLNNYGSFKLAGKSLSYLTSLSYKNEPQHLDIARTQGNLTYLDAPQGTIAQGTLLSKQSSESQNNETAQLSLLQNFIYHLKDSSNIYFKNFLLQQGQNTTILRNTSTNQFFIDSVWQNPLLGPPNKTLRDIILSWSQRFLYSGNLGGSHYFGSGNRQQLDWNGGYTYSRLDIPDQRAIHLQNNIIGHSGISNIGDYEDNWVPVFRSEDNTNNNIDLGMISRTWIRNTEKVYNASIDYTYKWLHWVTLKAGTYQQWKTRVVFRRAYTVNEGDLLASGYPRNSLGSAIGDGDPNMDFNLVYWHQQDLGQVWSTRYLQDNGAGLKVFDRTTGSDAYTATEQNNSGYAAASLLPFNGKLDVYGGLRVEYNRQRVAGALAPNTSTGSNIGHVNTPVFTDLKATSYLPSLNISYRPSSSWVLRGAYGKTVNRPELRELSPYSELDYINNQSIQGNPALVSARVDNYDARLEWYPHANAKGESISVGGFYKTIDHPIERTVFNNLSFSTASNITFINVDKAVVEGLEMDIRKNFDFIPLSFFRDLSLIANGAWIYSHASGTPGFNPVLGIDYAKTRIDRQLQGQSPYSVNIGLYYENAATGTKVAVMGNQVGPRIYAASVGQQAFYDAGSNTLNPGSQGSLIELTRKQLDLSITQRLVKSLQVKISIQNLLDNPVQMAEDANFTYKYEKPYVITPSQVTYGNGGTVTSYQGATIDGDILASDYRPGRFFLLTLTYGF